MNPEYPTSWQRKVIWAAVTALAIIAIGWVALKFILISAQVVGFLQPLLIPFAVAAVLAYLLEPVVERLCAWRLSRTTAVLLVFGAFVTSATLILVWIIPILTQQSIEFAKDVPGYFEKTRVFILSTIARYQEHYAHSPYVQEAGAWIQKQAPVFVENLWNFIRGSIGGFLGVFGFLLGLIITPLYLFYFLKESSQIREKWSDYLPLQASHFKDEVVASLTEINGYLVAFFRGQLIVSIVDGACIGLALLIMGLKFGLLIGLFVAFLGLIPYLGIFLCWIPAVIIAAVQYGDWQHPLIVTAIFIGINQLEGWLFAPKIVGSAVGLHPLTVIASVIGWSLLLGGLLGAILAVPLTATLKVLLRRYVWQRKFMAETTIESATTTDLG